MASQIKSERLLGRSGSPPPDDTSLRQHGSEEIAWMAFLEFLTCHLRKNRCLMELVDEVRALLACPAEVKYHRHRLLSCLRNKKQIGQLVYWTSPRIKEVRVGMNWCTPEPSRLKAKLVHIAGQFWRHFVGRQLAQITVPRKHSIFNRI